MTTEIKNIEKRTAGELLELANADCISAKAHLERLRHLEYVISCVVGFVKSNPAKTSPGAA